MLDNIDKVKIKKISILLGIFLFFFLMILLFLVLSRKSMDESLSKTVGNFLEQKMPYSYELNGGIKIKSGFSTSSYGFHLTEKKSGDEKIAVLINITTLYGTYPALFIYSNDFDVQFVGFIGLGDDFEDFASSVSMKSSIYFWQKKIPAILKGKGSSDVK